uniref:Uncharacterized protein n=1 Tax=Lepeophtheirus salmonis TaxID=72036 RepID=A0A0K2VK14_LEPSM
MILTDLQPLYLETMTTICESNALRGTLQWLRVTPPSSSIKMFIMQIISGCW